MTPRLEIGVVIPVHDEEQRLAACLDAMQDAVAAVHGRVGVVVVVVLDACTDRSAEIAAGYPFTVVDIDAATVGVARRAGVERARAELGVTRPSGLWIAGTDADSVVPVDWLTFQLDLALSGADVILGSVRPDFVGLSPAHIAHWYETHPAGVPNGNVHGANLGIRGSVYDTAGGFDPVAEHEDVRLIERARAAGASIIATAECTVVTSARLEGRTPGGYAGFLRTLAAELAGKA
ncbi:MAG: glycosyltransferase [Microbacteriaceae bacterium]